MRFLRTTPRYRRPTRRKTLVDSLTKHVKKDRGSKAPSVKVVDKLFDIKFSSMN